MMRLTLRTLLAYLDDILPPAETKQLGEKIAATPAASQLVDRIRDVMRRRRLTAPEPDGSGGGIEPNLVAEYLDNSLPPERVADVERVCLESDVNLAEAAACHQILTLVLGEPVEVSTRLRERMYALGPQGTPVQIPDGPAPSKRVRETNAREQLAAIKAAEKPVAKKPVAQPLESRLPDYLKRKPLWKRVLPWAAVATVGAVWFGLLYGDKSLFNRTADTQVASNDVEEDADKPTAEVKPAPRVRPIEPEAPIIAATELPQLPIDPEPPADDQSKIGEGTPAGVTPPPPTPATTTSTTETNVAVATTTPPPPAPAESQPMPEPAGPAEVAADPAQPAITVAKTNGVVISADPQSGLWFPLQAEEAPKPGSPIAVPEPFEADFAISGLPLQATALGGTRLAAFGPTEAASVGIDVRQGRIRFRADTAQTSDVANLMFGLRLGAGLWRIEPLTLDTVLGIEALPLQPSGLNHDLSSRTPQGVVYVANGAVRVADASGRVEVASAGNRLILTPAGGGNFSPALPATEAVTTETATPVEEDVPAPESETREPATPVESPVDPTAVDASALIDQPVETTPGDAPAAETSAEATPEEGVPEETAPEASQPAAATVQSGIPDWLTPREPTSAARKAMVWFQKEFIAGAPVTQSLLPAVNSPYYYVAEPAAKAIGLIEDLDGMVKSLRAAEHEEAILASINGLRNWLGRSPENGERLKAALEPVFAREGLSAILYELLWGYNLDDAKNEQISRQLVEWLDHPEPVVRELAFYHVKRLSGRTMYYRPLQSVGQRAGAVNRWRDFVNRNGGLVVSE